MDRLIERLDEAMNEPQDLGPSDICELGRDAGYAIRQLRAIRDQAAHLLMGLAVSGMDTSRAEEVLRNMVNSTE